MVNTVVPMPILIRRASFDAWVFALGTAMLAFVAVPATAIYLRSWRILLYYLVAFVLFSIVVNILLEGADESMSIGLILLLSIPFNISYAYAVINQLKGEAKAMIKTLEMNDYSSSAPKAFYATETRILRALAEYGPMTVGHICAATECSVLEVETELKKLVKLGLISKAHSPGCPPIYQVL